MNCAICGDAIPYEGFSVETCSVCGQTVGSCCSTSTDEETVCDDCEIKLFNVRVGKWKTGTRDATADQILAWKEGEMIGTTWVTSVSRPFVPFSTGIDWPLVERHRAWKQT